ncbi:MAG: hypothetical protein Q8R12_03170 [bacterium]|nr:hypothetical protein [bacterium]
MPLSWRARRQLTFLAIFAGVVILILAVLFFAFRSPATPPPPSLGTPQNLIIFWTRFFQIAPGHFEVASFIENPNLLLGTGKLTYRLRLYDPNNILIALKEGETFVNPREKFLIYEPDMETFQRLPARATIEFSDISWKRIEKERPQLLVARKNFSAQASRLSAVIQNQSLFPVKNIYFAAILADKDANALGVSLARADQIPGEGEREIVFTWRESFDPPPETIEVLARTNLVE